MKVTVKILILVLSIALAIGGVMVYAKTRVEPPVAFQPINQFEKDLNHLYSDLKKAGAAREEDLSLKMRTDLHKSNPINIEIS